MTRVIHYICNIKIKDFLLCQYVIYGPVRIMVFNVTFNNISIILLQSVLMVEKTRTVPGKKSTDLLQATDKLDRYYMNRCGRDRMVVGFATTCAISAYHH
jgi:hypothetical protein